MVAKGLMVALAALALSGCASASNCAGWSQINPSRADKFTAMTKVQIIEHNKFGERQGCWKAGG